MAGGKVFFDSNVLIYHLSGIEDAKELIMMVELGEVKGLINPIVTSEVLFYYIRTKIKMRPYDIKRNPSIIEALNLTPVFELLSIFEILNVSGEVLSDLDAVIKKYDLLPNDAIIAATCRHYGIDKIATFDEDFERVDFLKGRR
ncbi:type II toxin-antitoxin system VapC family toxin [Pyrococcus kukulkanii]|uniref:type II toxin-antitoxin system VapC family toxin n=1 Tax=Pyrococcus kukulkanii TaxID=1609559 RepID=UPI0035624DD8